MHNDAQPPGFAAVALNSVESCERAAAFWRNQETLHGQEGAGSLESFPAKSA